MKYQYQNGYGRQSVGKDPENSHRQLSTLERGFFRKVKGCIPGQKITDGCP